MSVQQLIDKELQAEQESKKDRIRSGKWSPSSFGKCYRAQYWNRMDEPKSNPPDERALRVFKVGLFFEKWVVDLLLRSNPSLQTQVRIETDDVLGFADLVNGNDVADIKTVHSKAFWYMEKCQDIAKEKYCNWMQVGWYAWQLKKEFMKLVFISKDDLTIAEYRLPMDGYWKGELDMELTKLNYYWGHKTLPPAEPKAYNGKECQYCNWKDKCQPKKEVKGDTRNNN